MFPIFAKNNLSSTESVDIIEKIVYEYLKPLGFRKHGRTLHRFVDTDILQVVNFQNGCPTNGLIMNRTGLEYRFMVSFFAE